MTTATDLAIDPVIVLSRLAARSLIASALFAAAAYWPARMWGGADVALAMLTAALVAWIGALCAAASVAWTIRGGPRAMWFGALAGLGVRFGVTLVVALALRAAGVVQGDAFLIWVGAAQLAVLIADTFGLVRLAASLSAEVRC
ncbi:MAG: hypothetical protein JNG88_11155 [Phycisphaerales bacterium]|nr:hypothetical protein [Phycisphaerales bacterium]